MGPGRAGWAPEVMLGTLGNAGPDDCYAQQAPGQEAAEARMKDSSRSRPASGGSRHSRLAGISHDRRGSVIGQAHGRHEPKRLRKTETTQRKEDKLTGRQQTEKPRTIIFCLHVGKVRQEGGRPASGRQSARCGTHHRV